MLVLLDVVYFTSSLNLFFQLDVTCLPHQLHGLQLLSCHLSCYFPLLPHLLTHSNSNISILNRWTCRNTIFTDGVRRYILTIYLWNLFSIFLVILESNVFACVHVIANTLNYWR